jgi:hypothetical protein
MGRSGMFRHGATPGGAPSSPMISGAMANIIPDTETQEAQ